MCNGMSSNECIFTGKKVPPNSNVQWNVFKRVYFYWKKSTPQFKIELISREYFFPCGSKFFPGKYYSGSTFFPGNYYSGSNFFRGVIIYGYTGNIYRDKLALCIQKITNIDFNSIAIVYLELGQPAIVVFKVSMGPFILDDFLVEIYAGTVTLRFNYSPT